MEGTGAIGSALVTLLLAAGVEASFNPRYEDFSSAVALNRTLVNIPHRLLCHELCLKDASCASFQYNETSKGCSISTSPDALEDKPEDEVDDSLHDLYVSSVLPMASYSETNCYSEPEACVNGHVCGDTCNYDGTTDCTCRSSTWNRQECTSVDVGTWEDWGPWGDCTVSCGGGVKTRTRTCRDQYGGTSCVGRDTDTKLCKKKKCPEWSEWSRWTKCSKCGASRTRTRTCPVQGHCRGKQKEKAPCMSSRECSTLLRLQRGRYVTDGWVEVWDQLKGVWRPLCGEWTQEDGKVACRHVGFKNVEVDTVPGIMSMGCLTDDPGDKDPADAWDTSLNVPSTTSSSPQDCLAFCRLRGFKYAAIRSGDVCQCGRGYARNGEVDPAQCSIPCVGDNSLSCGSAESNQLNSVYTYALLGSSAYLPMDEVRESDGETEIVGSPSALGFAGAGLTDGVVGKALLLNGKKQWAKTDLLDGTCLGSTSNCPQGFTVGMWIHLKEKPEETDRYFLSTGGHTQASYGFNFYYDVPDGPSFWVTQNYTKDWCTTSFEMKIDVWIYLTFTWKPPCHINIYVNSSKVEHSSADKTLRELEKDEYTALAIGAPNNKRDVSGVTGYFILDEVRFWEKVLTGKEVHEVMMHDLRMSGTHYYPSPGSKALKGRFQCTGLELLLGMCDFEEDPSLADDICHTSSLAFVRCVPNSWLAEWSDWGWCEGGRQSRTRKCHTPSPHYQGDCTDSPGPWQQVKDCDYYDY